MTGLEALELVGYLKDYHLNAIPYYDWLNDIEKYILKAEKEHKALEALEIIKEKLVDVFRFKKLDFNTFNQLQRSCKLPELTEEEYDLLNEVLGE